MCCLLCLGCACSVLRGVFCLMRDVRSLLCVIWCVAGCRSAFVVRCLLVADRCMLCCVFVCVLFAMRSLCVACCLFVVCCALCVDCSVLLDVCRV